MNRMYRALVAGALLLAGVSPAMAQLDTGTIVGAIVDGSGAVLPGVTVTATNEETGVTATSVTNASGQFLVTVPHGDYLVHVDTDAVWRSQLRWSSPISPLCKSPAKR